MCLADRLRELAEKFGHTIRWSVLRDGERVIVLNVPCPHRRHMLKKTIRREPPYRSAAGWSLLSGLSLEEQRECYKRWGIPGEYWPSICDEDDYREVLRRIRQEKGVIKKTAERILVAAVVEVGGIRGSIELSLPSDDVEGAKQVFQVLREWAETISREMECPEQAK